jgi:hypothetical protein
MQTFIDFNLFQKLFFLFKISRLKITNLPFCEFRHSSSFPSYFLVLLILFSLSIFVIKLSLYSYFISLSRYLLLIFVLSTKHQFQPYVNVTRYFQIKVKENDFEKKGMKLLTHNPSLDLSVQRRALVDFLCLLNF